jgi:hypothetical protein
MDSHLPCCYGTKVYIPPNSRVEVIAFNVIAFGSKKKDRIRLSRSIKVEHTGDGTYS